MDIQRIVNAQEALIELFPDLPSGITAAIANNSVAMIVKAKPSDFDPYWNVASVIENLAPKGYAPILSYQAAALYVIEADSLWMRALGEAPAAGDER